MPLWLKTIQVDVWVFTNQMPAYAEEGPWLWRFMWWHATCNRWEATWNMTPDAWKTSCVTCDISHEHLYFLFWRKKIWPKLAKHCQKLLKIFWKKLKKLPENTTTKCNKKVQSPKTGRVPCYYPHTSKKSVSPVYGTFVIYINKKRYFCVCRTAPATPGLVKTKVFVELPWLHRVCWT